MRRERMDDLVAWSESRRRKPLLLTGARQVGKTWLLKEFGRLHFGNVAYVNFDKNLRMAEAFEGSLSPERLIPILQAESGERIEPGKTLLIMDEIQEVPRAIQALKYFCEERPGLAVAAAGSSLGIELHRTLSGDRRVSFPVGKVSFRHLYPLSFSEFLSALGKDQMVDLISSLDWDAMAPFHDELVELVRMYTYVGGMPDAVAEFAESGDLAAVRSIQDDLLDSYRADFSKYAEPPLAERIRLIWSAIPENLAQENKKFVFKRMKPSARAREFEDGLQWLEDASLIRKVKRVNVAGLPLSGYRDDTAFKVYCHDVGLLGAMSKLKARTVIDGDEVFREFKGALGEQLAFQEMVACGVESVYYYKNDSTRSEIDFMTDGLERFGGVVPIEVKYGTNLRAKSLSAFVRKNKPEAAIRVSASAHAASGVVEDVPFYALAAYLRREGSPALTPLPDAAQRREGERPGSSDAVADAVVSLLEGCPLARRDIVALLSERRGIDVTPDALGRVLAAMRRRGVAAPTGYGARSKWELVPRGEEGLYALLEGDELDTGLRSTSRLGLLQLLSDNDQSFGELDPVDFWLMDAEGWRGLVDEMAAPDFEGGESEDLVAETGIPRDLPAGKMVLDVIGAFTTEIDVDDPIEDLNKVLARAFPDYGYRIVRGGLRL